jgi:hypothetical protein
MNSMTAPIAAVSYNIQDAATATGVSADIIRRAIHAGNLPVRYPTSRPVILAADLLRWVEQSPTASGGAR